MSGIQFDLTGLIHSKLAEEQSSGEISGNHTTTIPGHTVLQIEGQIHPENDTEGFENLNIDLDSLTYDPDLRRSNRQTAGIAPTRLVYDTSCLVTDSTINADQLTVPFTYEEAVCSGNKEDWNAAMTDEIKALEENKTCKLVILPPGRKAIKTKCVFDTKTDENNNITRFKARHVARGFT